MRIVVESVKGTCGAGHYAGQVFEIEGGLPQGFCPYAYVALYPNLRTLQFGGDLPWEKKGTARVACPDPDNPVVFRIEREQQG